MNEKVIHKNAIKKIGAKKTSSSFSMFITAVSIMILLLIFIAFLTVKILVPNKINHISYSEKSSLNYTVCLKENDFFETDCLEKNKEYIAGLIKNINVDYDYIFSASNMFDYNYTYSIDAKLIATEKVKTKKVIYEKIEVLVPEKTFKKENSNSYIIQEKIIVDYNKYNEIMKKFKREYAILFDSKLIITMNINTSGKYDLIEQKINSNQAIKLEIPLSEQTIDIAFNHNEIKNDNIIEEIDSKTISKSLLKKIVVFLCLIEIILIFLIISFLRKKIYRKNSFKIEVNKILREYDRFITTIKSLPHIDDKEIIKVTNFQELIDTRECINKPIMYCEVKKNQLGWFLIISDNIVYIYTIEK